VDSSQEQFALKQQPLKSIDLYLRATHKMIDLAITTLLVVAIILICRLWGGMRILTAITIGFLVGWLYCGLALRTYEEYDAFDSGKLSSARWCYAVFSTIAVLLLLLHVVVAAWREGTRSSRRSAKPA